MMKKILAVLLSLGLLPALVFAGGAAQSTSPATGPAEFTATFLKNDWHGDPNNMEVLKKLEKEANVKVNWLIYPNATWNERKNLILNSGDLPDVFYMNAVNNADIERYGPQGLFVDLTQLVNQYAPRLVKAFDQVPVYKALCTSPTNGKMYVIARAAEREANTLISQIYFYKPWLDKLGLKMPTTYQEFYDVLKAFKTGDPNGNGKQDEFPFSFGNGEGTYSITQLFSMFGYGYQGFLATGNGGFFVNVNDKAVFVPGTDRYKEAVIWLHQLFAEGLLNEEDFATSDTKLLNSKCHADPVQVGSFVAFDSNIVCPAERLDDYVRLDVPLKGPHGDQIWVSAGNVANMGGTQFVMTNKAKDQPAIMRWLDAHFDPRTSIELFLGPVGTTLYDNNGMLDYIPTPAGLSYSEFRYGNCPVHVPLVIAGDDWGKTVQVMDEDAARLDWMRGPLKPYLTQKFIYGYANADESKWMLAQGKDITDYFRPIEAKWLIQGGIEQEWDSVQARLKAMGVDDYTKIMQSQIDRFAQYSK
ncbi:MAG: extracellular solute-binding protein [Treponema sp.]|nr:extracellular solute-binding protein [Treponema sp.]